MNSQLTRIESTILGQFGDLLKSQKFQIWALGQLALLVTVVLAAKFKMDPSVLSDLIGKALQLGGASTAVMLGVHAYVDANVTPALLAAAKTQTPAQLLESAAKTAEQSALSSVPKIGALVLLVGLSVASSPARALTPPTFGQGPFAGLNTVVFTRGPENAIVPAVGLPVGGWELTWTFADKLQLACPIAVGLGAPGAPAGTLPVSLAVGATIGYSATFGSYVIHLALGPAIKLLVLQGSVAGLLVKPDATDFEWLISAGIPLPTG
jgi:hypothetical protein